MNMDSSKGETQQTEGAYTYIIYIYIYIHIPYRFGETTISNVNIYFLKSSNVHTNTFHAATRPILPYMYQGHRPVPPPPPNGMVPMGGTLSAFLEHLGWVSGCDLNILFCYIGIFKHRQRNAHEPRPERLSVPKL